MKSSPFSGLLPQQQSWDARHDAAQQHVEHAGLQFSKYLILRFVEREKTKKKRKYLAKIIGSGVSEAGVAEAGAAACKKSFVSSS